MENLDTTANNFFEVASNYTWIVGHHKESGG